MKNFISKYKFFFIFIFILILSLFLYFFVFANDDTDENKFTVNGISISSIVDGSGALDSDDSAGNDSSYNNGIVRNFDTVTYTVDYNLVAKEGQTVSTSDQRTLVVDLIFPNNIEGDVLAVGNGSFRLQNIFDNKKYVEFELSSNLGQGSFTFDLANINSDNGEKFTPIIVIKESTDIEYSTISSLTEDEKGGSYDSVSSKLNKSNTCNNTISGENSCEVTVSGVNDYFVNLYQGSTTRSNLTTNIPVGIMIGLSNRTTSNNESKGIKGLLIPNEVSFDIKTTSSSTNNSIQYVTNSARNYQSQTSNNNMKYTVYIDSGKTIELPEVLVEDYSGNGDVTTEDSSNGLVKIKISNIKNILGSLDENTNYFSTVSFEINSVRSESENNDITIGISAVSGDNTLYTLNVNDSFLRFVGSYESEVELYDSKDDVIDLTNKKPYGEAVFNYNEEFYINTTMQYAKIQGDGLDSLTDYIKIDNTAIDLVYNNNGMEYDITSTVDNNNYSAPVNDDVLLGYGKWNTSSFTISSTAPSGCPSDISSLSKDDLINLYGGPCIEEVQGKIKWVSTMDDQSLTETEKDDGPIIVKTVFNPAENNQYVYPGTNITIRLKAKIKNKRSLTNNSYKIVNSATGLFKDSDNNTTLYYLSNQDNHNGIDIMQNTNNFTKTDYNFDNASVNTLNNNVCNNPKCAVSGNTVLVSAVRVSKPEVRTYYESYDTTNFYYYPIEWRINTSAYKNDNDAVFEKAYVYAYLPSYLKYVSKGTKGDYRDYDHVEDVTINNESYKKYTYEFSGEELNNGSIPTIRLFTNINLNTPDNTKPKVYVTSDFVVTKRITKSDSTYDIYEYRAIDNPSYRTQTVDNVTLHNNADLTLQGTATPTYIEKKGTYSYNMIAYNNSAIREGTNYSNVKLYYVLPYQNDSSYSDTKSEFKATEFKVKIKNVPTGYKVYYTKAESSIIINTELKDTDDKNYTWTEWNNPTTEITGITAVKIEKTGNLNTSEFFGDESGITAEVTPVNGAIGDKYYNSFYIVADKPSNYDCTDENDPNYNEYCVDTIRSNKIYFSSTRDLVSIYNRMISGFVWEDQDGSGLYEDGESRLSNIPVSVYKIKSGVTGIDENNPSTFTTEEASEWVADTTTDSNGRYQVRGLTEGKYFVKFTYDDNKYNVTDKNAGITSNISGAIDINSKAVALANKNIAISSIVQFGKTGKTEENNINLGLKIKKQFSVDIKKYITSAVVSSPSYTKTHTFKDGTTQATINIKNPSNTSIRVTYNFVIENTKYFPGYIGIIADKLPVGMKFDSSLKENQDWTIYEDTIYYTGLSGRLILPDNKYYFSLVLDLDVTQGGNYVNLVAVRDLILMDEELSDYDFSSLDLFDDTESEENIEEGE